MENKIQCQWTFIAIVNITNIIRANIGCAGIQTQICVLTTKTNNFRVWLSKGRGRPNNYSTKLFGSWKRILVLVQDFRGFRKGGGGGNKGSYPGLHGSEIQLILKTPQILSNPRAAIAGLSILTGYSYILKIRVIQINWPNPGSRINRLNEFRFHESLIVTWPGRGFGGRNPSPEYSRK